MIMTETLYIRLGSKAHDVIHWLIWSEQNREIIASGELAHAEALTQLTEKAQQRTVITFVSGSDVILKQLTVPGNSQRAIRLAAPYMLEDALAQDVEQLFFAYANIKNDTSEHNCFVAVVERAQLAQWQHWLNDANIACRVMIPDVLALPINNASDNENITTWSAIILGEQILLRQSIWQGMVIDQNIWPTMEQRLNDSLENAALEKADKNTELQSKIKINSYSALNSNCFTINAMPEELPLALLAENANQQKFNLLQGEFQVKQQRSPMLANWLSVAAVFVMALLLTVAVKVVKLQQISAEQAQVKEKIVQVYKKAFPKTRRVNVATVRSQLKRKLAGYGSSSSQEGFLTMLTKIRPAFATVPQLKPQSIKFDAKRQELRLQASANDYQAFEKFKIALEKAKLTVSQGSLNNQGDQVTGSFSIKG
jgi:general secretion pathway protein L